MAKTAQGIKVRQVSASWCVRRDDFQAGIAERCAGKPPRVFDEGWQNEYGRLRATALIARGIDPLQLTFAGQARWFRRLLLNGTIVR